MANVPEHNLIRETSRGNAGDTSRSGGQVTRARLEMPVLVRLPGEDEFQLTKTVEIGVSGGLLVIPREVHLGDSLLLVNPKSSTQVVACHVRYIRPKKKDDGRNLVAVEFATESPNFWGVTLSIKDWEPAADSLPQSPELTSRGWRAFKWPALALAGVLGVVLWMAASHSSSAAPEPAFTSASQDIAPQEGGLIPGIENYRLARAGDFDPDAVLWLTHSGQLVGGEISGAFSGFSASRAYVLKGRDAMWRVSILADGRLRCDALYKSIAIVVRVPKETIGNINWADPPPGDVEGDGLLIVRSAKDLRSGVVLFLRGDQVVSGAPVDYRLLLLNQPS